MLPNVHTNKSTLSYMRRALKDTWNQGERYQVKQKVTLMWMLSLAFDVASELFKLSSHTFTLQYHASF